MLNELLFFAAALLIPEVEGIQIEEIGVNVIYQKSIIDNGYVLNEKEHALQTINIIKEAYPFLKTGKTWNMNGYGYGYSEATSYSQALSEIDLFKSNYPWIDFIIYWGEYGNSYSRSFNGTKYIFMHYSAASLDINSADTLTHEVGHALGLRGDNYNFNNTENNRKLTPMDYGWETNYIEYPSDSELEKIKNHSFKNINWITDEKGNLWYPLYPDT